MSSYPGTREVAWPKMTPAKHLLALLWPLTARLLCRLGSHHPLHAQCERECWCLFCERPIARLGRKWHSS